nr:MAG TPA: hypothetical protein [Caudoviricetes sp.]
MDSADRFQSYVVQFAIYLSLMLHIPASNCAVHALVLTLFSKCLLSSLI